MQEKAKAISYIESSASTHWKIVIAAETIKRFCMYKTPGISNFSLLNMRSDIIKCFSICCCYLKVQFAAFVQSSLYC